MHAKMQELPDPQNMYSLAFLRISCFVPIECIREGP